MAICVTSKPFHTSPIVYSQIAVVAMDVHIFNESIRFVCLLISEDLCRLHVIDVYNKKNSVIRLNNRDRSPSDNLLFPFSLILQGFQL